MSVPTTLNADQLAQLLYYREVEEHLDICRAEGGNLFHKQGVSALDDFRSTLWKYFTFASSGSTVPNTNNFAVFHLSSSTISTDTAANCKRDLCASANWTIWHIDTDSLDEEGDFCCTLLNGSEEIFSTEFWLSSRHVDKLPFFVSDEMVSLLKHLCFDDHDSNEDDSSPRSPAGFVSSGIAAPTLLDLLTALTRSNDEHAMHRAAQAAINAEQAATIQRLLAAQSPTPATAAADVNKSIRRLTQALTVHVLKPIVAPVIHVSASSSDSKRQDFAQVIACYGLYTPSKFEAMFQPSEWDVKDSVSAYNMLHARNSMLRALTRNKGPHTRDNYTAESLKDLATFLWNVGMGGLRFDNFLAVRSDTIGDKWPKFVHAFSVVRAAVAHAINSNIAYAMDSFLSQLTVIQTDFPSIPVKTLVFIAEEKMGDLLQISSAMAQDPDTPLLRRALSVDIDSPYFRRLMLLDTMGTKKKRDEDTPPTIAASKTPKKVKTNPTPASSNPRPTAPKLKGKRPCFDWIRGISPCNHSGSCTKPPSLQNPNPRPHSYDVGDAGAVEQAHRAWTKLHAH